MNKIDFKPSTSEEHGLGLIADSDKVIFSAGISTGGAAEIRMAQEHPASRIIATTIDEVGLKEAQKVIDTLGLSKRIDTKIEDLRTEWPYAENQFDFVYARLVLHYLSVQDLEKVLKNFFTSLKPGGRLFVVVRSVKNFDVENFVVVAQDEHTCLTTYHRSDQSAGADRKRYFHTPETISEHLKAAGFQVAYVKEYEEQLYRDFLRTEKSTHLDHLIEVLASKPSP